jgi:1-hydroxycarotenoid 3,4-desaturase
VFFSRDYEAEFDDLFRHARVPREPTVYVCAQDRLHDDAAPDGPERLLCLINAPADGDHAAYGAEEIESCADRTFEFLERCGLRVRRTPDATVTTTPAQFARLFPATGGALYGQASHGWQASFRRPGSRTRLPGLYLAGGSAHPGAGVPMAAISGRLAATRLLRDLASTSPWRLAVTSGGTSTR